MPFPSNLPNIVGTFDSRDLQAPVSTVAPEVILDNIEILLELWNGLRQDVIDIFADYTTVAKETYEFATAAEGSGLLQNVPEYGGVLSTKPRTAPTSGVFDVAFPIWRKGSEATYSDAYLLRATLQKLNDSVLGAFVQDAETMFRYVLAGLMKKTNYDFYDDKVIGQGLGNLTVRRLLNADGQGGRVIVNGVPVDLSTMNSYKTSGTANYTNATFTLARNYLRDLGLDGDLIFLVSRSDADYITANCSTFVPVVLPEDDKFIYPNGFAALSVNAQNATAPSIRSLVKSPRAIGRIRDCGELIVLPYLPNGYMIALDRNADKPLVIRECDLPNLRGFNLVKADAISNTIGGERTVSNKRWQRLFGVGTRNRANGVIVQITASSTYTDPSFGIVDPA